MDTELHVVSELNTEVKEDTLSPIEFSFSGDLLFKRSSDSKIVVWDVSEGIELDGIQVVEGKGASLKYISQPTIVDANSGISLVKVSDSSQLCSLVVKIYRHSRAGALQSAKILQL